MFTPFELSNDFRLRSTDNRQLIAQTLARALDDGKNLTVSNGEIIPVERSAGRLLVIKEGFISVEQERWIGAFLESGDLIDDAMSTIDVEYRALGPVVIGIVEENAVQNLAEKSLWKRAVEIQHRLINEALSSSMPYRRQISFSYRFIQSRAPIIIEDTDPNEVFVMLAGSATVFVRDIMVGAVLTGEIFGAMAASLNSRRTASVIAREPCVVCALPKAHFFELARTYPQTVLKLIEDMARIIVQQNEKIASMSV